MFAKPREPAKRTLSVVFASGRTKIKAEGRTPSGRTVQPTHRPRTPSPRTPGPRTPWSRTALKSCCNGCICCKKLESLKRVLQEHIPQLEELANEMCK